MNSNEMSKNQIKIKLYELFIRWYSFMFTGSYLKKVITTSCINLGIFGLFIFLNHPVLWSFYIVAVFILRKSIHYE